MDKFFKAEDVVVVGRTSFDSGIGAVSFAACELLSRYFSTSIYPINSADSSDAFITLPSGRLIPVAKTLGNKKVFFFTDVIWNNAFDFNYTRIPDTGLRIAHVAYDSSEFPPMWVEILNKKFDKVYFSSSHLVEIARYSGVKIPIGVLPIGLYIDDMLTMPFKANDNIVHFGSVASFHPRKGAQLLIKYFNDVFGNQEDVCLTIHSNLSMSNVANDLISYIEQKNIKNIRISTNNLSNTEKTELINSFDIFANLSRGEGYSIGPREALALGKAVVLSKVGPHNDLLGCPGVFGVDMDQKIPARYPEIDNMTFGYQDIVSESSTKKALSEAYNYVKLKYNQREYGFRKLLANEFSNCKLARNYAETVLPPISLYKPFAPTSKFFSQSPECTEASVVKLGVHGNELQSVYTTVVQAHDGGFFSVFNAFMSHLVWETKSEFPKMVLPDWNVKSLIERSGYPKSFCYGKPEDGNLWCKLFEPLYGLTVEEMNSNEFLYSNFVMPNTIHNEDREPLMTYKNAYDLYISPYFKNFRKEYNSIFRRFIKVDPAIRLMVDNFVNEQLDSKLKIAVHIKHPSHVIEQPDECIAYNEAYVQKINDKLVQTGQIEGDYVIFLATDQDRVVKYFREIYGDKIRCFDDVRRTTLEEDSFYDSQSNDEKRKEGYQVQHIVASNTSNWNIRMAQEVIRDALVMSSCDFLFHIVSNVATAVSYFNPDIEMIYVN